MKRSITFLPSEGSYLTKPGAIVGSQAKKYSSDQDSWSLKEIQDAFATYWPEVKNVTFYATNSDIDPCKTGIPFPLDIHLCNELHQHQVVFYEITDIYDSFNGKKRQMIDGKIIDIRSPQHSLEPQFDITKAQKISTNEKIKNKSTEKMTNNENCKNSHNSTGERNNTKIKTNDIDGSNNNSNNNNNSNSNSSSSNNCNNDENGKGKGQGKGGKKKTSKPAWQKLFDNCGLEGMCFVYLIWIVTT